MNARRSKKPSSRMMRAISYYPKEGVIHLKTAEIEREVSLAEHIAEISRMYYVEKMSYQEIGDQYGRSREAVRQLLDRSYPDRLSGREFRKELLIQQKKDRDMEELIRRLKEAVPCVICGCWVLRKTGFRGQKEKTNRTCSPACSKLWVDARYKLDPLSHDRQRQSNARAVLRNPDGRSNSELDWAKRVLSKNPPPPNRTYTQEGSRAAEAMEQIRKLRSKTLEPEPEVVSQSA